VIGRREALLAAGCLAAAALAQGLAPRRHVTLMRPGWTLAQIVPTAFADWTSRETTDPVALRAESDLASRLYREIVGRIYVRDGAGLEVLMMLAYGDTQSNILQLHRPEVCYPAFGFAISQDARMSIPVGEGLLLPSRRLVARAPGRLETILYWTRLGDDLPVDQSEQQMDRLRAAFRGVIPDGLLARFSIAGAEPDLALAELTRFVPALLAAVDPLYRPALIGGPRAEAMRARALPPAR
jgi:EpsI family protein